MEYLTSSPEETATIATGLAARLEPGDLVALRGDLGAGKSVFARAAIRALCGDSQLDVPSPTFTLVQIYEAPVAPVWHFDLYRLQAEDEIYELGWEDCRAGGIAIIEWPDRIAGLLPASRLDISFSGSDRRHIVISSGDGGSFIL